MEKYYIDWADSEEAHKVTGDFKTVDDAFKSSIIEYKWEIIEHHDLEGENREIPEQLKNNEIEISIYEEKRVFPCICIDTIIEKLTEDINYDVAEIETNRIQKEIYGSTLRVLNKLHIANKIEHYKFKREKEKPIKKDLQKAMDDVFKKHNIDMSVPTLEIVKTYKIKLSEILGE